jgi:YhcH/YjgK/YiaL family protein
MICGRLAGWPQIEGIQGLEAGFEFLEQSNLATLPMGKHEILGDTVYALAMKSSSRSPEDGQFESHRNYIDIQYLVSGEEMIGIAPVGQLQGATPYDAGKDVVFYAAPARYHELRIPPGHFAVFFPDEGHLPLCHSGHPEELHKVVIKVRVDYWSARRTR